MSVELQSITLEDLFFSTDDKIRKLANEIVGSHIENYNLGLEFKRTDGKLLVLAHKQTPK